MIIDEINPLDYPDTPPLPGGVSVPLEVRIDAAVTDPSENHRLKLRAEDFRDSFEQGHSATVSAVETLRANLQSAIQTARDPLTYLIGLYRGNATRISQEAVDGLSKIAINAQANVRRRIQLAEQCLWLTPARPVRARSETAIVNTLTPVDAAGWMIQQKAEATQTLTADGSAVSIDPLEPGGGEAGPTDAEVISAATEFGTRLRSASKLPGNPAASGPIPGSGGGDCIGGEGGYGYIFGYPPGLTISIPGVTPGVPVNGDTIAGIYSQFIANGFEVESVGADQSPPAPYIIVTIVMLRASDLTKAVLTFSFVAPDSQYASGAFATPFTLPGAPAGYLVFGQGFDATVSIPCESEAPPPPPPPPPATSPPPPPPPLDPVCCPPDPAERDKFGLTNPVPPLMPRVNADVNWCTIINQMVGASETTPPPVEGGGGGAGEGGEGDGPKPGVWWSGTIPGTRQKVEIGNPFRHLSDPVVGSQVESDALRLTSNQEFVKKWAGEQTQLAGTTAAAAVTQFAATVGAAGWAQRLTGAPALYLYQPFVYALQYLVPTQIPGQSDADLLYLTNKIDDAEWECITRSNGNTAPLHRKVRDSKVELPNVQDYVDLYMRQKLTYPELREKLRVLGVVADDAIQAWIELRNQIPQFADIIRFMVRDTENDQVVSEGRLSDGFTENYKGVLKQWGDMQGVGPDLAMKFWQAHWDLPSPTMAFEMLKRLRPGAVPDELVVTKDQVQRLLSAADYAPGWRDKMIAISYLTPTRTDIKQGYSRGVYDRATILEMLQDTGLNKEGAESVAKLYDWEKSQFQRTRTEKTSAFTVKTVLAAYIASTLNRQEAKTILAEFGFDEQRLNSLLDSADLRAVVVTREKCIRSVRRQYFVGAITEVLAIEMLEKRGVDRGQAEDLVQGWDCERSASVQEVPARKNLDWAVRGVITIAELQTRLERLRYNATDVDRYAKEAELRISQAVAKANEKAIRDLLADLRRREAEARRRLKELEAKIKEAEKKEKEKGGKGGDA